MSDDDFGYDGGDYADIDGLGEYGEEADVVITNDDDELTDFYGGDTLEDEEYLDENGKPIRQDDIDVFDVEFQAKAIAFSEELHKKGGKSGKGDGKRSRSKSTERRFEKSDPSRFGNDKSSRYMSNRIPQITQEELEEVYDLCTNIPEEERYNDPELNNDNSVQLPIAHKREMGFAKAQIESMNWFYNDGISNIITNVFSVNHQMKYERDSTAEEREIEIIDMRVTYRDVKLSRPVDQNNNTGVPIAGKPTSSRVTMSTYACSLTATIDFKITARLKSGETKMPIEGSIVDHRIASLPAMTLSNMCSMRDEIPETLLHHNMDPKTQGGTLILKGLERVIELTENMPSNQPAIYSKIERNEFARCILISKPGDTSENSYQTVVRYMVDGQITVEVTINKNSKLLIPFRVLMAAMGVPTDKEIADVILCNVDKGNDNVMTEMSGIVRNAINLTTDDFSEVHNVSNRDQLAYFIGSYYMSKKANVEPGVLPSDENAVRYVMNEAYKVFDTHIYPHIGQSPNDRMKKMQYLGYIIYMTLCVGMDITAGTDRNHLKNKRIAAPGISLAKSFKTAFNFAVNTPTRDALAKAYKTSTFSQVDPESVIRSAINADKLRTELVRSIVNSSNIIRTNRGEITNRVQSQILVHKNVAADYATLNSVTSSSHGAKQTEQADIKRRVHSSYTGYYCNIQSADTGEKVGTNKQTAITACITSAEKSYKLKDILVHDELVILPTDVDSHIIHDRGLSRVFVNGDCVGYTEDFDELARKYRFLRRCGRIHPHTSICKDLMFGEVNFWVDFGRLVRPLVIVYNNLEEHEADLKKRIRAKAGLEPMPKGEPIEFKQWTLLRYKHMVQLSLGQLTTDDLVRDRVIEYIGADEQEDTYVASSIDKFKSLENNPLFVFTHVDVPIAMLGLLAISCPMANHSNTTRVTYFTNHKKSSTQWPALNFPYQYGKGMSVQWSCGIPIVTTCADAFVYPSATMLMVAIKSHGGYNMEDSIVINDDSTDRGQFMISYYDQARDELELDEYRGKFPNAIGTKVGSYGNLDVHGIVKVGTICNNGQILIAKAALNRRQIDTNGAPTYRDTSIQYTGAEEITITHTHHGVDDSGTDIAVVVYCCTRKLGIGDKLSSKTGNKGIVSIKQRAVDMDYDEYGVPADAEINMHSFPSRLAINQMIEGLLSLAGIKVGKHVDSTIFTSIRIDAARKILKDLGLDEFGLSRMYNPKTGDWLDTLINLTPQDYQRIQKFVMDEWYAVRVGATNKMTGQAAEGKNKHGGMKNGEMESATQTARGTSMGFYEKTTKHSDGMILHVCQRCHKFAAKNLRADIPVYKCTTCGDRASIVEVGSTKSVKLFLEELNAIGINTEIMTQEPIVPIMYDAKVIDRYGEREARKRERAWRRKHRKSKI